MTDTGYGCMNCKHWGEFYGYEHGICRGLFCKSNIGRGMGCDDTRFISATHDAKLITHADFFCNGWELDSG